MQVKQRQKESTAGRIVKMSLRLVSSLNAPPLVAAAGLATLVGLPFVEAAVASSGASLALLKGANAAAFAVNCAAVSVPGRLDGPQDDAMRKGDLNPDPNETTNLTAGQSDLFNPSRGRGRSLVLPSGWAFAIWGPIYLGEAVFVGSQFVSDSLSSVLPQMTPAFIAANIFQSLWCASFRASYDAGWRKYVSAGMLASTAYALSHVNTVACSAEAASLGWYFLPLSLHFGWMTAATLVNLNGSIAMENVSDSTVVAFGHGSAIGGAALGAAITLLNGAPAYGFTVAWALAAVAAEMGKRVSILPEGSKLKTGANVQKMLCYAGSAACIAASVTALL